jgi:predicted nucleotidyltransferase component of viral defense system
VKNSPFYKEADLMVQLLPEVAKEVCFALKGGTAINFFWRDMPRLSVDIDLAYLPIEDRDLSLANISAALDRIAISIEKWGRVFKVHRSIAHQGNRISKLVISNKAAQVKIEPNEVIRGFVFESVEKDLCSKAEVFFEKSVSLKTLSFADLYGGKLCAALDRQHPRDIFDIKILLEHECLTEEIRKAFIVYLSSHDRPMN